jgi:prepilin-type N-terminal cleavage/methylation domain-containing protein
MKFLIERLPLCARTDLKKRPDKGFTIFELVVVLACIATLSAVATPTFLDYLNDTGLKQAVHQLSGDLYRAKSQAIRTQTVQTVNLDQPTSTYVCTNPNRNINLADYWGNPTFTDNPDGGSDVFSPAIAFDTRGLSGLVPAATTQVYLTGNGRTFRVQVSAAGAVSIHEWRGGAWIQ